MAEYLRLARLYMVVLGVFAIGRWVLGMRGVPYERGSGIFSIVIMTLLAAVFYGAFGRRWRGFGLLQAVALTALLGLMAQVVILAATLLSYGLDLRTYFNHPTALNATEPLPFVAALQNRLGGAVGNTVFAAIAGALGWVLGVLLPEPGASRAVSSSSPTS